MVHIDTDGLFVHLICNPVKIVVTVIRLRRRRVARLIQQYIKISVFGMLVDVCVRLHLDHRRNAKRIFDVLPVLLQAVERVDLIRSDANDLFVLVAVPVLA